MPGASAAAPIAFASVCLITLALLAQQEERGAAWKAYWNVGILAQLQQQQQPDASSHLPAAGGRRPAAGGRQPCPDTSHFRPTCLDSDGPVPYILLTFGRSGSTSTTQIIGNLTGYETPGNEYTGSFPSQSREFFSKHTGADNDRWVESHLCSKQLRYPEAGTVTFKWKLFDTIFGDSAWAALRTVACLGRPKIAVVWNRRNLLDVRISIRKHDLATAGCPMEDRACRNRRIWSHCLRGDAKCLQPHVKAGVGLVLPTGGLLKQLTRLSAKERRLGGMLRELGVPHVTVRYEKLYYGGDTSEWMRIFRFLGVGPGEGLTRERLEGAMRHVATHPPSQNTSLANYADVAEVLRGTEFEELLRP